MVTDSLLHRNGFTGQHRLIDTGATFDDFPIDRHLLARSYAKQITHMHVIQRNVLFAPIGLDAACRLGRQPQQRLDGCRGFGARPQFQQLAEQRERDDDRRCFEVDPHPSMLAERVRKQARRHGGHHAVAKRGGHADADQRPHVGAAIADGLQAAFKEWPPRPEHHWSAQHELNPGARLRGQAGQTVSQHGQD